MQVASSASGNLRISKHNLLSGTATQGSHNAGEDLLLGDEGGVVVGDEPGETTCLAAGDQGNLLDSVMARSEGTERRRKRKENGRGSVRVALV